MSQQIDLSIATSYVKDWTYIEAMRELFQNALDAETQDKTNVFEWKYQPKLSILSVSSALSRLERGTLLLGSSAKQDDNSTIGQFGEGYKIALMVLLREGFNVQIINPRAGEVWTPHLAHSEVFQQTVLRITISSIEAEPFTDSLEFSVGNVTPEHMTALQEANLNIASPQEVVSTERGNILFDEKQLKRIYVNGLYVETAKGKLDHGYDIKPEYLSLDRDRRAVDTFDLYWVTSQMWAESKDYKEVLRMLSEGVEDVRYLPDLSRNLGELTTYASEQFYAKYGKNAVPVTSQEEYDMVIKFGHYKPIICPEAMKRIIIRNPSYVTPKDHRKSTLTPQQFLSAALTDQNGEINPERAALQIPRLLKASKRWRWTQF